MVTVIDEATFKKAFENEELGDNLERALNVFKNYGVNLSYDVTNVLLHAVDKEKVEEVLDILEKHWIDRLQYQHPMIRGLVKTGKVNPTEIMFEKLCRDTLGLKPNTL